MNCEQQSEALRLGNFTMRFVLTILVSLHAVIFIACGTPTAKRGEGTNKTDPQLADEATQKERERFIDKMKELKIIDRIATTSSGERQVWVLPEFRKITSDEQESFMRVVAEYQFRVPKGQKLQPDEMLWIGSALTEKCIGTYSSVGLRLD